MYHEYIYQMKKEYSNGACKIEAYLTRYEFDSMGNDKCYASIKPDIPIILFIKLTPIFILWVTSINWNWLGLSVSLYWLI